MFFVTGHLILSSARQLCCYYFVARKRLAFSLVMPGQTALTRYSPTHPSLTCAQLFPSRPSYRTDGGRRHLDAVRRRWMGPVPASL